MEGGLQVPSKTEETQTKPTQKKRNSRMTDFLGGEPGSVILANSRTWIDSAPLLRVVVGGLPGPWRVRPLRCPEGRPLVKWE